MLGTGMVIGSAAGALLSALGALGISDQEQAAKDMKIKLEDSEEFFKSTPFTKEEIMNELLPEAQKMYRSAADVSAGKIGAAVGESGVASGQAFGEYFANALAPVIADGENRSANAISKFGQWWSNIDAQAKQRFANILGMEINNNSQLPNMTEFQKVLTAGMQGAGIMGNLGAGIDQLNAIGDNNDLLKGLLNVQLGKNSSQNPKSNFNPQLNFQDINFDLMKG